MTNTEMLKNIIEDRGMNNSYISRKMGISRTTFYKKLMNKTMFTSDEIIKLCNILMIKSLKDKEKIFFANDVD